MAKKQNEKQSILSRYINFLIVDYYFETNVALVSAVMSIFSSLNCKNIYLGMFYTLTRQSVLAGNTVTLWVVKPLSLWKPKHCH